MKKPEEIVIPELEAIPDAEFRRTWSARDDAIIAKYWRRKPLNAIAKYLKRTPEATRQRAMRLGLPNWKVR